MEGELTRDVKKFGDMNAFVTFTFCAKEQKSPVLKGSGKTPKWENCQFDFVIKDLEEKIRMEVWGKNAFKNRSVGYAELSFA